MGGSISYILPSLYLGDKDEIKNKEFFETYEIKHVLSLGPFRPPIEFENFLNILHINLPDSKTTDIRQ
jgi:hypothetical protein